MNLYGNLHFYKQHLSNNINNKTTTCKHSWVALVANVLAAQVHLLFKLALTAIGGVCIAAIGQLAIVTIDGYRKVYLNHTSLCSIVQPSNSGLCNIFLQRKSPLIFKYLRIAQWPTFVDIERDKKNSFQLSMGSW